MKNRLPASAEHPTRRATREALDCYAAAPQQAADDMTNVTPSSITVDGLLLDADQLRTLLRVLVGSVVVRPDGLAFAIRRQGRQLSLLPIDITELAGCRLLQ